MLNKKGVKLPALLTGVLSVSGAAAVVTSIENAANDIVSVPSDTEITISL